MIGRKPYSAMPKLQWIPHLSKQTLCATTAGICLAGLAAPMAHAQSADSSTQTIEEITITGSRIVRRDFTSPSPVATVDSKQLENSGSFTVEQVLNELPQLQANNTSNVNAPGGAGTLTADLRGLGAERTLVLVNGRRFAPADSSGVVDLASIPQSLIERVEVVTGGASAVYGSDAIAGVVNFILKDDFEGIDASYSYGTTERGDGESHKVEVTMGGNFADNRGNAVLYASYTTQNPVFQADRSFSETALFEDGGQLVPGGSSRVPGSVVFGNNLVYPDGAGSADCSSPIGAQFTDGGKPRPFCLPENGYNFAAPNYLLRPRDRYQIAATGHYQITDDVQAYGELIYLNTQNNLQQAPAAVDFELVPGTATLPVPLNNPLLPATVRDFLAANFDQDNDGVAELVGARRRFEETGPRQQIYDRNSFQIVGGLRGEIERYNWDLFYQYGRTSTDEQLINQISNLRIAQGLNVVVNPDNSVSCADPNFGCVPINIFGFGSITDEARNFLTPTAFSKSVASRQVIGGSVAGDLFELPAGPVGAALGFEYRKETADYRPDATIQSGELGSGQDGLPLSGSFDLWEVFAETRVPILADVPFAQYLGLEAAARYSHYSTVGGVFTFKAGGEWAPIDDIRFRALFQRAVRAPNAQELFAGQSSGSLAYSDPCDVDRAPSQAVKDFCVAQGVPANGINSFQQDDVVNGVSGGNPNLNEERSNTYTLGAVIQPTAIPALSVSVDYYSVKVSDAISTISVQEIIDSCFATRDLADPSCQLITRISNGRISQIRSFNANIANFKVDGLDVAANYQLDLPDSWSIFDDASTLTAHVLASWQFHRETQSAGGEAPIDCAGYFGGGVCSGQGIPIVLGFKALASLNYQNGPLGINLQGRYLGSVDPINDDNVVDGIAERVYGDLAVSYRFTDNFELTGVVNNLFDTDPPILGFDNGGDTNTDPAVYDPLGRSYFIRGRITF